MRKPNKAATAHGGDGQLRIIGGQRRFRPVHFPMAAGPRPPPPLDLVFLDPPFSQNLLLPACNLLEQHGWLAADAWVYTESENPPSGLGLPGNWRLHREQKAGQVYYALWQRSAQEG